jgi:hypothetical protein
MKTEIKYTRILSTQSINYWVQLYKNNRWNDCWKHESVESAEKNIESAKKSWPDAEYRIIKREIVEEIV